MCLRSMYVCIYIYIDTYTFISVIHGIWSIVPLKGKDRKLPICKKKQNVMLSLRGNFTV